MRLKWTDKIPQSDKINKDQGNDPKSNMLYCGTNQEIQITKEFYNTQVLQLWYHKYWGYTIHFCS